jgi:hypothetical protein
MGLKWPHRGPLEWPHLPNKFHENLLIRSKVISEEYTDIQTDW